jgi:ion channel-forming bestrophin family protein
MINYNPKVWIPFIFKITKADTFRKLLPLMLIVGVYSGVIGYCEMEIFQITKTDFISNLSLMHGVLGFVISLLLVFRTNTAYDRWWEGRKLWGALTNNSRNLAIKLHALVTDEKDKLYFRSLIPGYAFALKSHLRENENYEVDPVLDLKEEHHIPNQLAAKLFSKLNHLYTSGTITGDQFWLLNEELRSFTDICGACERIKNTPIPFTYSVYIKKFIFLYVLTLPFGWTTSLGYYIVPVVMFILYAFASLELIAEEIENPFGTDPNDLPIDQICANIRKHVGEII